MGLTILDASSMSSPDFGQQLLKSLSQDGFVKLINHDIQDEEISDVFRVTNALFKMPHGAKQSFANQSGATFQRGWSSLGDEKTWSLHGKLGGVGSSDSIDYKEHFDYGSPDATAFPNKWPSGAGLPEFRAIMEERFFKHCRQLSLKIMEALASAMDLPHDAFVGRCQKNDASTMRLNYFPPVQKQELDSGRACRIWPHFDFGIISLVFRDIVGGLEMEDRRNPGQFVPIACESRRDVVVNVGETLQRWTNDVLPAALHRVTKPPAPAELDGDVVPERISLAYFCKADLEASVGPFAPFVTSNGAGRYEEMTALQYQEQRNSATY